MAGRTEGADMSERDYHEPGCHEPGCQGCRREITENFHGGNRESVEAFESVSPEGRRKQREKIVAYVTGCGDYGATSDEAERALGLSHQTCSARFSEAERDGLI